MSDTSHPISADGGMDDLPRTLRRAREERNREAQAAAMATSTLPASTAFEPERRSPFGESLEDGVVTALRIPFFRLMLFFIKAVFAAIPALIILGVILWFAGHALEAYFPQLIKMKITIAFPN